MSALLIIIAAIALLFCGYVFYGSWLAKQWGIDPTRKTPAQENADGVDYVAAKPAVLMGHHFSSIAGAGPINGPIQAAVFGWVPVFLWCVVGGIFFGGLQDFSSLFASARNEGKSVGEIIKASMGKTSKKLFILFALLVLILVIASFVNVVAGTFASAANAAGQVAFGIVSNPTGPQTTAMISLLFIVLAVEPLGPFNFAGDSHRLDWNRSGRRHRIELWLCDEPNGVDCFHRPLHHGRFAGSGLDFAPTARLPFVVLALRDDGFGFGRNRRLGDYRNSDVRASRLYRLVNKNRPDVPGLVHHRRVRRVLGLPLVDFHRNDFQAA